MIGWLICMDYSILNETTSKDLYAIPFIDYMFDRLERQVYCFPLTVIQDTMKLRFHHWTKRKPHSFEQMGHMLSKE